VVSHGKVRVKKDMCLGKRIWAKERRGKVEKGRRGRRTIEITP